LAVEVIRHAGINEPDHHDFWRRSAASRLHPGVAIGKGDVDEPAPYLMRIETGLLHLDRSSDEIAGGYRHRLRLLAGAARMGPENGTERFTTPLFHTKMCALRGMSAQSVCCLQILVAEAEIFDASAGPSAS
jgi:hypothetical protein